MKRVVRNLFLRGGVALVLLAAAAWWFQREPSSSREYITVAASRGNLSKSVSASGSLKPLNTVVVSTQVTGPIIKIHVDFNDEVKKGQLLAEIDPTLQQAQIQQTEAQISNAESSLALAELNAKRLKALFDKGYVSRSEWERTDQDARTARTSLAISRAQLDRDRTNLAYATVRAPVDGVIIARAVNEGQTVQSSFQAPELFKIAEDLTKMQIELSLSEADIGLVKEGQQTEFTVDAFPDRTFEGKVTKLHLSPKSDQGVVSYTAIIDVENTEKTLLPGMTAYVRIVIEKKEDVLNIPLAALYYTPTGQSQSAKSPSESSVYVLKNGKPAPVSAVTGMQDDRNIEIVSGDIKEGDLVIVRESVRSKEEE